MIEMDEKRLYRLKLIYGIALAFIALTLLSSSFLMQYAIRQNSGDSRVINLSGRQRMLSQRLTKTVFALEHMETPEARAAGTKELTESFAAWKKAHLGLQQGDEELGLPQRENSPEVMSLFAEIEPFHAVMVHLLEGLANEMASGKYDPLALRRAADMMLANEAPFLGLMDKITFQFDREARERITFMRRLELFFLALGLSVLAFEFLYIFRPSLAQLTSTMAALRCRNEELEEAFGRIKRLEGIIPICMYCKKIRDDGDLWQQLEKYITENSDAVFSHGICPDCFAQHFKGGKTTPSPPRPSP